MYKALVKQKVNCKLMLERIQHNLRLTIQCNSPSLSELDIHMQV